MFDLGLAQITNRRCRQTRGLVALVLLALAHPPICEACSVYELTGTSEHSHRQHLLGP